jgi:hypothetical protein
MPEMHLLYLQFLWVPGSESGPSSKLIAKNVKYNNTISKSFINKDIISFKSVSITGGTLFKGLKQNKVPEFLASSAKNRHHWA